MTPKPYPPRMFVRGDQKHPMLSTEVSLLRFALEAVTADPGRYAEMLPRDPARPPIAPITVKRIASGLLHFILTGTPPDDPPAVAAARARLLVHFDDPADTREPWEQFADAKAEAGR